MKGYTGIVERLTMRDGSHKAFKHTVFDGEGNVVDTRNSTSNLYGFAIAIQREHGPVICGYSRLAKAPGSKWQYGTVAFSVPLVEATEATENAPELQAAPEPPQPVEESPEASGDPGDGTEAGTLEATIAVEVASEIRDLEDRQKAYDADATRLQAEKYAAEDADDTAAATKAHDAMMRAINAGITVSEKITTLRSPAEVERRVQERLARTQQSQRLSQLAEGGHGNMANAKTPKVTAASQGFPTVYLGPGGNFKPGMDARAKSDLILSIVGSTKAEAAKMRHQFTRTEAETLLKARGWMGFLARKQEIAAEKAAKAEAKKADTKKAIEAKKTTGEAKPDPKPAPRKRSGRGGARKNTAK